jgi:PAS domain S-box-containing protein
MRIENRLTVSLLIIFLLLGMVGAFGLVATKKIVSSFDGTEKELRTIVLSAIEIGSFAKRAESHLVLYLTLHNEVDKDKFYSRHDDLYNRVNRLEKILTEPEALEILEKVKVASSEMMPVGQALLAAHEYDMAQDGIFEPRRYESLINKLHDYTSNIRRYGLELAHFETDFLNRQAAITAATELSSFAKRAHGHLMKFLILDNDLDKRKFFLRYDSMVEQINYLEKRLRDPEALKILAEIKEQSAQVLPAGAELIRLHQEDIKSDGRFIGERHVKELQKLYSVTSSLRKLGNKLVQYNVGIEESKQTRAIEEAKLLQRYIIVVFLVAFVIMVFLAYFLTRSILKPLKKLQAATVEIGAGNLTAEIDIDRKDEFGELAASFQRMAEELHRTMISKDYVSRIIESMIEGMAVVNNNGIIEMVNHALCRMTGYDEYELIGRPIISLIEGRGKPELRKIFSTESVSESVHNVELNCKTKTGRLIPILFSRSPLFDVDRSVQGVVCIMFDITIKKEAENVLEASRDQLERRVEERTSELQKMNAQLLNEISERRQTEEALQQSEAYYRAIVEDQTELICRFRGDGTITFANEACCIYFEKSVDELLQQKFVSIFPSPEQENVERLYRQLSVEHPVVDYITEVELPTGEMRWHHWTLRLILDRKNEPFEFQAVGRDITEQKDLEQKIKSSAERIKFFAYSVSHDLKNPAINIYGLTKILKKNYKDLLDEKGRKFCDQILQSSEQVTALVDKINQFITTAEAPLHLEQVNMKQVLKLIVDEFSSQFHLRNIQWSEPETVPDIRMDRLAFIRVMRNVIDNALKYGGEDLSEISVGYEETDQHHVLSISNNGTGIPEESYEKVFGLFEREQGDGKVEGSGLGLAIVREMTERHKGKAWLGPYRDDGVTFYISILKFL